MRWICPDAGIPPCMIRKAAESSGGDSGFEPHSLEVGGFAHGLA